MMKKDRQGVFLVWGLYVTLIALSLLTILSALRGLRARQARYAGLRLFGGYLAEGFAAEAEPGVFPQGGSLEERTVASLGSLRTDLARMKASRLPDMTVSVETQDLTTALPSLLVECSWIEGGRERNVCHYYPFWRLQKDGTPWYPGGSDER